MVLVKLKSRLQQSGAARDVATLTVGTVIAQGITIAVTPLLTRLYSPSDFGLLAVFLAVVSVSATLFTLRYETSILVPKENAESANLVFLSLILGGGLSLVLAVLSTLLTAGMQEKIGLAALGNWISIAFLIAGGTSVSVVMQVWMNRHKKYKQITWLRVAQSFSSAILSVILGILHVSNGLLITQVLATVCLCLGALWLGRSEAKLWDNSQIKKTALAYKNAPKYLLPTAVLDVVTLQMPVVLIATWYGAEQAGQFSMAWRLLMVPMALIGGAISQVFMQRLSSAIETPDLAKTIIKQSWIFLFAIGLIPLVSVLIGGEFIFKFFLGEKWLQAGSIATILAPMTFAMLISSPTSGTYVILGLQKYSLIFGLAVFIYRSLCIYIGVQIGSMEVGIKLWVAFEIIQIFVYQLIAWKKLGFKK